MGIFKVDILVILQETGKHKYVINSTNNMSHKTKVPSRKNKLQALESDLAKYGLKIGHARQACMQAAVFSQTMAKLGYDHIHRVMGDDKSKWVRNFNNDLVLVKWFGKTEKKGHVKDVRNRMLSIAKRINKGLTIRLRPQKEIDANARNHGGFADPRAFRVFPMIFKNGIDTTYLASVYIHEMMHLWFQDQIIGRAKVNNEHLAKQLARFYPKKARKSAENYERYCKEIYGNR